MRRLIAAAVALLVLLPAAASGSTAPLFPDHPPVGFSRTAEQVTRLAERTQAVQRLRAQPGRVRRAATYEAPARTWQVNYDVGGQTEVQVVIDDRTGQVRETWTGVQARWLMARPLPGKFGHRLNAPYVWIPLCLVFLVPFVDFRRLRRMLHLDLLVLVAFGASLFFFNRGQLEIAVPLAYPVLAYLLVRMLVVGWRPRYRPEPLVPTIPITALVVGLVFLVGFRAALNIFDSGVTDVGYAGVIGADRIVRGDPLYGGHFPESNPRGDTYGPVMYLAYLPFLLAFGWSGTWDELPAAHAAAIAFDLLTVIGLLILGRTLRPAPGGARLGIALAFAWTAYPFTSYVQQSNTNDSLVSALLVFTLVAFASRPARGALIALAGATKLAPLALIPLFAAASRDGKLRLRELLLVAAGVSAVMAAAVIPFIVEVGWRQALERTLVLQFTRESPFSLWGQQPSLQWAQRGVQTGAIALALAVALVPRRKDVVQVAALAAAVIIALQIGLTHWSYLYVVWFLPLVLLALFAAHSTDEPLVGAADPEAVAGGHHPGGDGARLKALAQ